MILGCSNRLRLGLLFLVLLPVDLHAHGPGAPREVPSTSTTPNTKAPEFVLLNQEGNRFESTKLHGKVVVLNFIFTTCTDVCLLCQPCSAPTNPQQCNGPGLFLQ